MQTERDLGQRAEPAAHRDQTQRRARENSDLLTIASVPRLTTKWLVPWLTRFLPVAPSVTLSFRRHLAHGDAFPFGLDAAIRYGDGAWEGVRSDYLNGRTFVPICTGEFAERHALHAPTDAVAAPHLVHEQAEIAWSAWAERHRATQMNALAGPRFEQYSVLIQAAQAGLGLAIVPRFLIVDNLAAGTLVEPFDAPVDVDAQGHYLCYAPERLETSAARRCFREWMLDECANG